MEICKKTNVYLEAMRRWNAHVVSNACIGESIYAMAFTWEDPGPPLPGQFCTIRVSRSTVPLLRRPFAFSAFDPVKKTASIIFKKRGPATEILAGKKKDDMLDVIGPLGNSFCAFPPFPKYILVAGGTGLGPIFFWDQYLAKEGRPAMTVLGYRSKSHVPCLDPYVKRSFVICTEDGSMGFRGTTIDYLRSLGESGITGAALFCCGPSPMLKACVDIALLRGVDCFVSMEQIMACGVGACMGCVVRLKADRSFARVCAEGPIFNGKTLAWT